MWIHSQCSIQPSMGHWWGLLFIFLDLYIDLVRFAPASRTAAEITPLVPAITSTSFIHRAEQSGSEFSCWLWLPRGWCYCEVHSQWSCPKAKSVVVCLLKEGQDFAAVVLMTWELSLKILNLWCCLYVLSWGTAGTTGGKQLHTQEERLCCPRNCTDPEW